MQSFEFPKRSRQVAHDVDVKLLEVLEQMLTDNEGISLRSVLRHLEGIGQPSSISRDEWRSRVLQSFQKRQDGLRTLMEKADKSSKTNLSIQLEKAKHRIAELEQRVETLTASHKAMILAVGQIGGMSAWKAFYGTYEAILDDIRKMGAMPSAEVAKLHSDE